MRGTHIELDALKELFSSIEHGFCVCEIITTSDGRPADYRFLSVNRLFEEMTGLTNAVGRTALELVPNLEPFWIERYGAVALSRRPLRFQQNSEPMNRWFDVYAAPADPHGQFTIVFRDISGDRALQNECTTALARAEALLEELNHRVMNSLGMIASIVGLEARGREDGEGRRALERVSDRVRAVADLYRALGTAHAADHGGAEVRADDYLKPVVDRLQASVAGGAVTLHAEIGQHALPTSVAAPLGLIVNELVTNSLKHAFDPSQHGTVTVALRRSGDRLELTVADNGRGIPPQNGFGIGRKLVSSFVLQLQGDEKVDSHGGGTVYKVSFPVPDEIA